ncbi:MAG: deoxyribodipyrimidine photo-lyase [Alphaproteobacteria bacterium]|jgi:deoxyribodipyrimidine photo-lyase
MTTSIHWFRQDLRLSDNPALFHAVKEGDTIPIYILDESETGYMGATSKVWLHHALASLNESLNGKLVILKGDPAKIIPTVMSKLSINSIYWNKCYEPWRIPKDKELKKALTQEKMNVHSFNGSLLWEPWENLKGDGTPYKVFTPYYKNALKTQNPRKPLPPIDISKIVVCDIKYETIKSLNLLSSLKWHEGITNKWNISEDGAHKCLSSFISDRIDEYADGRNFPAKDITSKLSPYLHFGQISPNEVWHKAQFNNSNNNIDTFCSELGWREFSYNLLYHNPEIKHKNLQAKFDHFPWCVDLEFLQKWQMGQTGYPIVDAGMRELWQTGYMHNRVRMIVASFLVKNLLIHWTEGEKWFWDCLVDADHASNSASWQWVAGCGSDAAPYFRIFNPITQGEKFDKLGSYTKKYVPELKDMPPKYLFKPWDAPAAILTLAGVKMGCDYPMPIVDVKESRERALEAYSFIKG